MIRRAIPFDTGSIHFVGIGGIGMSGIAEVLHTLEPIHNWFYHEGRPENNDPIPARFATAEYQS